MSTLSQIPNVGRGPEASWPGWAGYAPTARGPEARRARAQAAGILEAASAEPSAERVYGAEPPVRCGRRSRPADGSRVAAIRARSRLTASA